MDIAMSLQAVSAVPDTDDVLRIVGRVTYTVGDKTWVQPLAAQGWVSAVTNHYPPDAYGDDGHIRMRTVIAGTDKAWRPAKDPDELAQAVPVIPPRQMTAAELADYCERLLWEGFVAGLSVDTGQAVNLLST